MARKRSKRPPKRCCICKAPLVVATRGGAPTRKRKLRTLHGVPVCKPCLARTEAGFETEPERKVRERKERQAIRDAADQRTRTAKDLAEVRQMLQQMSVSLGEAKVKNRKSKSTARSLRLSKRQNGASKKKGQYDRNGLRPSGRGQAPVEKGRFRKAS